MNFLAGAVGALIFLTVREWWMERAEEREGERRDKRLLASIASTTTRLNKERRSQQGTGADPADHRSI